jgi:hypothetical protein
MGIGVGVGGTMVVTGSTANTEETPIKKIVKNMNTPPAIYFKNP